MASSGIQMGVAPVRCTMIPSGYRVSVALLRKPKSPTAIRSCQLGAMVLPT